MAGRRIPDYFATEQARIEAGEPVCGYSCACHGPLVCQRAAHPDVDGDRSPHIARDVGGNLTQWIGGCCDGEPAPEPT